MSKERTNETNASESASKLPELSADDLAKVNGGRRGRGPGRHSN